MRTEDRVGHVRTPFYIRGKIGRIDQVLGEFLNPELLAYGHDGLPKQILYKVVFSQGEVWDRYQASSEDKLYVDIFDHWLEQG